MVKRITAIICRSTTTLNDKGGKKMMQRLFSMAYGLYFCFSTACFIYFNATSAFKSARTKHYLANKAQMKNTTTVKCNKIGSNHFELQTESSIPGATSAAGRSGGEGNHN